MIFYDYQKLWVLARGDSTLLVYYFKELARKAEGYQFLIGDNYIANEDTILKNKAKLSTRVLAEYLGICALRSYTAYKYRGVSDLSLEMFPAYVPKSVVDSISILEVIGKNLIFREES